MLSINRLNCTFFFFFGSLKLCIGYNLIDHDDARKSISWMLRVSTVGWLENEGRDYQMWPRWTGQGPFDS